MALWNAAGAFLWGGLTLCSTNFVYDAVTPPKRHTCLAYFNVGQGETYRTYWSSDWRAPTAGARGTPDFLLAEDPDGWPENYPVAFWDPRWRSLLLAALDEVVADGFDGLFVDWVLGYAHPPVAAAALAEGIDPARAMVDLLRALRERAPPGFLRAVPEAHLLLDFLLEVELDLFVESAIELIAALAHVRAAFRTRLMARDMRSHDAMSLASRRRPAAVSE